VAEAEAAEAEAAVEVEAAVEAEAEAEVEAAVEVEVEAAVEVEVEVDVTIYLFLSVTESVFGLLDDSGFITRLWLSSLKILYCWSVFVVSLVRRSNFDMLVGDWTTTIRLDGLPVLCLLLVLDCWEMYGGSVWARVPVASAAA
jgi:hypothetical protein